MLTYVPSLHATREKRKSRDRSRHQVISGRFGNQREEGCGERESGSGEGERGDGSKNRMRVRVNIVGIENFAGT
jgi:hypothetical protein